MLICSLFIYTESDCNALWQAQLPLNSENYGENVNAMICAHTIIRWISDTFDLLLTDSISHEYKFCKKKKE